MANKKAIAYVDGNNLYHGIIDKRNIAPKGYLPFSKDRPWGDLLWLNLESFIREYHFPIDLIKIKFFQAPSYKPDSLTRQQLYQNALLSLDIVDETSFFFGEFREYGSRCHSCREVNTYHVEKRTDAAMSTEILSDFFQHYCEASILVGGDSDQLPVVQKIKLLDPRREIYAIFPPFRKSKHISELLGAEFCGNISYQLLLGNQFRDTVFVDGFQINKPLEYRRTEP